MSKNVIKHDESQVILQLTSENTVILEYVEWENKLIPMSEYDKHFYSMIIIILMSTVLICHFRYLL